MKTLKELQGSAPEYFGGLEGLYKSHSADGDLAGLLDKMYNPAALHLEENLNDSINTVSVLKLAKNIRKLVKEGCKDDKDKDDGKKKKKKAKKEKKEEKKDDEKKDDEKKDDKKDDEKKDDKKDDEKKDDKKDEKLAQRKAEKTETKD